MKIYGTLYKVLNTTIDLERVLAISDVIPTYKGHFAHFTVTLALRDNPLVFQLQHADFDTRLLREEWRLLMLAWFSYKNEFAPDHLWNVTPQSVAPEEKQ